MANGVYRIASSLITLSDFQSLSPIEAHGCQAVRNVFRLTRLVTRRHLTYGRSLLERRSLVTCYATCCCCCCCQWQML